MRRGRRILAARYLRCLATLENLIVNGHYADARRLLDSLDPQEARSLASDLERNPGAERGTSGDGGSSLRLLSAPGISRKVW